MVFNKCYLSFRASSLLVVAVDLVGAVVVTILSILSWQSIHYPTAFFHTRRAGESPNEYNRVIEACVTYWIVTIILFMVVVRLVIAALLFGTVKKKSVALGKAWIPLKLFGLTMALFLVLSALTVGLYTRLAAGTDLLFHLVTLYQIKVVADSFQDLERQTFIEKSGRA